MKVGIVTPSYNQGRFIERTLKSVAVQRGAEIEHLVFDGGSTDETIDVLKRAGPAVRWVSAKDRGQTDAVNQGFRATDGEIIGWLNSDDVYYPDAIARVVGFFAAHPDVDVVYGLADHIDVDDATIDAYGVEPWNFDRLCETCFICQPALFMRRRTIERFGLLDESLHYCMDYEYWLRLGKAGARFALLNERLAGSRVYPETKTLGARVAVHREINDMFRRTLGRVPDSWLYSYAHAVVERRVLRESNPKLFALRVGVSSLLAALRWNHTISSEMLSLTYEWIRGAHDKRANV